MILETDKGNVHTILQSGDVVTVRLQTGEFSILRENDRQIDERVLWDTGDSIKSLTNRGMISYATAWAILQALCQASGCKGLEAVAQSDTNTYRFELK